MTHGTVKNEENASNFFSSLPAFEIIINKLNITLIFWGAAGSTKEKTGENLKVVSVVFLNFY